MTCQDDKKRADVCGEQLHWIMWRTMLSSLLLEPLSVLYPLLPLFLLKSLHAETFHIVLLTMLKPMSAFFAFYWSEQFSYRQSMWRHLLMTGMFARLPIFLAIFCENLWMWIIASTCYMLFYRAGIPAWMEILKRNLLKKNLEKLFSMSSAISYGEGVIIAIFVGALLDRNIAWWKWLFGISILIGFFGLFLQTTLARVKKDRYSSVKNSTAMEKNFQCDWKRPWMNCLSLMKQYDDFRYFQWTFMIGGFGLMIIQPVLPIFFVRVLQVSYFDFMKAYAICKGLGFMISSSLWNRLLSAISIHYFIIFVIIGFSFFPLLLLCSTFSFLWVYVAYFCYGCAQAGSHLIWHLSGLIFSREEQSMRYSGVNIIMVGIRGCLGPPIGGLLIYFLDPCLILEIGIFFCLSGACFMLAHVMKKSTAHKI